MQADKIKTLNKMGSMFIRSNPALEAFLKDAENSKGYYADIGCAYGHTTFEALKVGAKVLAADLDQGHLDILYRDCPDEYRARLETISGHFPNQIDLPQNAFDGIFISRLFIFLTPEEITTALRKLYSALKVGGKVYFVTPSPIRKVYEKLRPIYEAQKAEGVEYPGSIANLWEILPDLEGMFPNKIQLIDVESIIMGFAKNGFEIEASGYYPDLDPADDLYLDLTYVIATKT